MAVMVLFLYGISMMVGFYCQSVLFSYEISVQHVLFFYHVDVMQLIST